MAADLLRDLIAATLAASAAIALMIAVRAPLRKAVGSRVVYATWMVVPLATSAVFLPAPPAWLALFAPEPVAPMLRALPAAGPVPFDWTPVLIAVWLAGAAAGLVAVWVLQHRALRRLERESAPGPAVVGVIAPRIVLPADFESRFSPDERKMILSHEQVHLSLGDVRVNAAVALFACLFWFNPLVHLAARLVRMDQELSCDEAVIARHPEARRTYAEALLKTQLSSASMPLGCYWPERSHQALKERLNMLTLKHPGRGRVIAGAALLCALGLGTGYVAWAAAPQEPQQVDEIVDTQQLTPDGRVLVQTAPGAAPIAMTIAEHDAYLKVRYGRQADAMARPAPRLTNSDGDRSEVRASAAEDRMAAFVDIQTLDRTQRIERDGEAYYRYTGPPTATGGDRVALERLGRRLADGSVLFEARPSGGVDGFEAIRPEQGAEVPNQGFIVRDQIISLDGVPTNLPTVQYNGQDLKMDTPLPPRR